MSQRTGLCFTESVISIGRLDEADFSFVSSHLDKWWGGRPMSAMLPRLWFKDFSTTSLVARDNEGRIVGFLVGYVSASDPTRAYVHFIGVDPGHRMVGLGRKLYFHFRETAVSLGCSTIDAVTSPSNENSLAFHQALGFEAVEPDGSTVAPLGSQGFKDYDGIGEDRVLLRWRITLPPGEPPSRL
jgi:L-amino acid N-acyltransferase YncA